jgi:two-component system sensor histidine kinase PhcS
MEPSYLDNKLQAGYDSAFRDFRLEVSRGGAYIALILVLLGVVLDYGIYPQDQFRFAVARVMCASLMFSSTVIMQTDWGKKKIQWLTFAWLLMPQIMITWMIAVTEGANSIYDAGLYIAIFGSAIALPFSLWQNLTLGGLTYFLYVAACSFHPSSFGLHGPFVVNSFLLMFVAIASAVCTFYNERARHLLFRLKAEVAEKNIQLEETNKNLANIKGQMLQQEKMAAIGTLAAGLLHEVNNPVNYCLMAINIALEEPVAKTDASLNECLLDAKQGMQRIQHIVSDLKTFAYRKSDASADGTVFLLEKVVDSALRLVSHETKGISISCAMPSDTLVRGDEAAIIGVLVNLLSNAALAMRAANRINPEIHVSATWIGERLHVTVQDNGPGILPENLSRVFEPFFTTREIGQGLGLGLSISYSVIEQHGGVLHAESELGEWTKMIFDLPRAS